MIQEADCGVGVEGKVRLCPSHRLTLAWCSHRLFSLRFLSRSLTFRDKHTDDSSLWRSIVWVEETKMTGCFCTQVKVNVSHQLSLMLCLTYLDQSNCILNAVIICCFTTMLYISFVFITRQTVYNKFWKDHLRSAKTSCSMSSVPSVLCVWQEGKQAALAADFSVTQFKHLGRLLMVHGRNSYKRSAALSQFVIHRSLCISAMQVHKSTPSLCLSVAGNFSVIHFIATEQNYKFWPPKCFLDLKCVHITSRPWSLLSLTSLHFAIFQTQITFFIHLLRLLYIFNNNNILQQCLSCSSKMMFGKHICKHVCPHLLLNVDMPM